MPLLAGLVWRFSWASIRLCMSVGMASLSVGLFRYVSKSNSSSLPVKESRPSLDDSMPGSLCTLHSKDADPQTNTHSFRVDNHLPRICLSRAILAGNAEPYTLRMVSCLICSCCLGYYSSTTYITTARRACYNTSRASQQAWHGAQRLTFFCMASTTCC